MRIMFGAILIFVLSASMYPVGAADRQGGGAFGSIKTTPKKAKTKRVKNSKKTLGNQKVVKHDYDGNYTAVISPIKTDSKYSCTYRSIKFTVANNQMTLKTWPRADIVAGKVVGGRVSLSRIKIGGSAGSDPWDWHGLVTLPKDPKKGTVGKLAGETKSGHGCGFRLKLWKTDG